MLYYLAGWSDWFGPLRVFESIVFRTISAMAFAFLLMVWLTPGFIAFMKRRRATEDVEKPDSAQLNTLHASKKDTPTMGGLVIIAAIMLTVFLFANPGNPLVWVGQGVLLGFGLLGFVDDYMKLKGLGKKGMIKRQKLAGQIVLSLLTAGALAWGSAAGWFRLADVQPMEAERAGPKLFAWFADAFDSAFAARPAGGDLVRTAETLAVAGEGVAGGGAVLDAAVVGLEPGIAADDGMPAEILAPTRLVIPFTKWSTTRPDLSWGFWLFVVLILVACSNAVNLTDGLDGLAAGCTFTVALAFAAFTYIVGNEVLCAFFRIPHVPRCGELTVYAAAMAGSLLGFLWYNAHPAKVFMGDTGALPLGAALAFLAVATKHELVLILAGGVYVLEAGSVILQILSFKMTGKRLFRCAPFHHHLEFGGWHENHVVVRMWIAGAILAALALGTLKMH